MFYSVFDKKHCVSPFFGLTKNIITLKHLFLTFLESVGNYLANVPTLPPDENTYLTESNGTVGCTVQKSTDTQHQCHDQDDWLSQLYFYCPHVWSERWSELKSQVLGSFP